MVIFLSLASIEFSTVCSTSVLRFFYTKCNFFLFSIKKLVYFHSKAKLAKRAEAKEYNKCQILEVLFCSSAQVHRMWPRASRNIPV